MAKAKKGIDKSKEHARNGKDEPPSGFTEQVASTDRAAGWVIKREGVIVQGRLLGRQEMRSQDRAFYRIELHRDVECTVGKGEDAKEVTCVIGEIVNVDESTALEDLEPRTRDGGIYDVWIRYGKQAESNRKGQKGFWPADIRLKVIEEPTRDAQRRAPRKRDERDRNRDRDDRRVSRDDDHDYGRPTRDRDEN